ncbi:MAG TPA: cytochrome c peroxidase [Phycisphaerales bacterium]|nr:cytochrome c peroxidase [Phycisphaerales bacterium]
MREWCERGARLTRRSRERLGRVLVRSAVVGVPVLTGLVLLAAHVQYRAEAALPPLPVPPENPITESKRVLGKMLFWDEQLSASNVVTCGTCHSFRWSGSDPRIGRNPGDDGIANTLDDVLGSPGVIRSDVNNNYVRDSVFGLQPQVSDRAAMNIINAAYLPRLFWDGRIEGPFYDPQTGVTVIASGGSLESQATRPPLNAVEMAHSSWDWPRVIAKLERVTPLALATNVPADVEAARQARPTYPELFAAAFGDSQITAARVGMAIATYQRTLISNQSPFDAFRAGNVNALTTQQRQGFIDFQANNCGVCHTASQDLFTDHSFRNIGLRPVSEDPGRQAITGNFADRGRFKVPTLRNVALKASFMHNGQFQSLAEVMAFYARAPGAPVQQGDNLDGVMNLIVPLTQQESENIIAFLNGLTDPRVANETAPFDRPVLFSQRPGDQSVVLGGGTPGSGGVVPQIIVQAPAMIDSVGFRVGVYMALGNTTARLGVSRSAPVNGVISPEWTFSEKQTSGAGNGMGVATEHWDITLFNVQPGARVYVQWQVLDPAAQGGVALSSVGQITFFCSSLGCGCDPIDFNRNGVFPEDQDVIDFFNVLAGGDCTVTDVSLPQCDIDFNNNTVYPEDQDVIDFFNVLAGGSC